MLLKEKSVYWSGSSFQIASLSTGRAVSFLVTSFPAGSQLTRSSRRSLRIFHYDPFAFRIWEIHWSAYLISPCEWDGKGSCLQFSDLLTNTIDIGFTKPLHSLQTQLILGLYCRKCRKKQNTKRSNVGGIVE